MAILDLLMYPNPILSQVAKPVENFTDSLSSLLKDMADTMYEGLGVGLAAPQIGISERFFLIDVTPRDLPKNPKVFINPTIVRMDSPVLWNEGCLSLPNIYRDVKTFEHVILDAFDAKGRPFHYEAEGLEAVAILHEYRHLDGEMFIDRLPPVKRNLVKKFWKKNAHNLCEKAYEGTKVKVRWS